METVISCFLCGNDTAKSNVEFYDIQTSAVSASQKPIHVVLQHLANCIKYKLIFQSETFICADCFKEMSDYDDLMVNLLSSQKRLTVLLQNALMVKQEDKPFLEDENEQTMDFDFEDDEQDPSLVDAFNPNLDTKEELIEVDQYTIIEEEASAENENDETSEDIERRDNNSNSPDSTLYTKTGRKRQSQECVVCGAILKSKFHLQNHMSEYHNLKRFSCKICGVTRKDEEYLELHMNLHEGKTENECRYCPKRFTRPVNTLRHMRIHWDKKKFQCEKCGERFSLDNMLYNHRLRHEAEENPLICSICNQSFKSRKTYTHHLLIHQENRPRYHCHLCPKSFTERYTLKMHLKTHSGDKSCESPSSSSIVSVKSCQEENIGILEDTESYDDSDNSDNICVICNKKYDEKIGLEQHLQDVHDVILK